MNKANLKFVELKHYRLVREIIEHKTVSAAAQRLLLSQSAASRQLSDLEYAVGSPVFSRINKKMVPTTIGRLLGELATDIQKQIDKTKETIDEMYSGLGGKLRFGSLCNHSYGWLSDFILFIQKEYPNFSFSFYNVSDLSELIDSKVDFVISSMPDVDDRIVSSKLFSDEMVVVVSNEHEIACREYIDIEELLNENMFIYYRETSQVYGYYMTQMEFFFKRRLSRAPHLEAALSMVRAGMGVTFMPRWALQKDEPNITGVRLLRDGYPLTWSVLYLPSILPNQRFIINELINFTKNFIA